MNKKNTSSEPGERVRELRKKLGLSRAQFEKITGVSASTLRYLETGERDLSPPKARLLSTLFTYRFSLTEEDASEGFLLTGEKSDNSVEVIAKSP